MLQYYYKVAPVAENIIVFLNGYKVINKNKKAYQ